MHFIEAASGFGVIWLWLPVSGVFNWLFATISSHIVAHILTVVPHVKPN